MNRNYFTAIWLDGYYVIHISQLASTEININKRIGTSLLIYLQLNLKQSKIEMCTANNFINFKFTK